MTTNISEKANDEYGILIQGLVERSREKFDSGIRSGGLPAINIVGIDLSKDSYLLSSYMGASITTITTADNVWLMTTDELPWKVAEALRKNHAKRASSFISIIDPNKS